MSEQTIQDNQQVAIGLVIQGSNPDNLTIVSASWTATDSDGNPDPNLVVSADTLTAEYTAVSGDDTTVTLSVVATTSDGTVQEPATATLTVTAAEQPLTIAIVFATPTGGSS